MAASIFNGDAIKLLKEKLRFKSGTEIISNDSDDPTSVAKDAPIGSIYIRSGTGEVYVKQDAGSSTNWKQTTYKVSVTANRALVSDGNGDVTSSSVTDTEIGYVSGVTSSIQTQVDSKLNLSGGTMTGTLVLDSDGASSLDAVTKQQLDAALDGVQRKQSVVVATTSDITLSGEQTIDGVLTSASRVLVKDQSTQTENGIYVSDAGAWSRSSDANTSSELNHAVTSVESGTANADTAWEQTTDSPNIGVDNVVWAQTYGAGTYTADGQGIELSGATFSLEIDGSTLSKSATGIKVADLGVDTGQLTASAVTDAKIATGVDAAKLADGSVSNTEFQYINSLSSNAQTQLDGKVDGPGSSTNNAVARYDATTGKIIQNSGVLIDDSNNISGVVTLDATGLDLSSSTQVSSTLDEDDMISDSATALATQQSIKTYTDSRDSINYILNNRAVVDTTGYATYADAAATEPVDGTGGSPSVLTLSRTTTASEILRGSASFKIAKSGSNGQGEGVSYDFTIDETDQGKRIFISFDHKNTANYSNGYLKAFVYDVTNASLIGPVSNDEDGDILFNSEEGEGFTGGFYSASDSVSYRIIFHTTTTTTTAWDFMFDNFKASSDTVVPGAIISNWKPYTATLTNLGNATQDLSYRRVGDSIEIKGRVTIGSTLPTGTLTISLPSGLSFADTSNIAMGTLTGSTNSPFFPLGSISKLSSTEFGALTVGANANWNATNPATWVAAHYFEVNLKGVEVDGWSAGAVFSTTENLFLNASVVAGGSSGQVVTANTEDIDFTTITDNTGSWDGSKFTAPAPAIYSFDGVISAGSTSCNISAYVNGTVKQVVAVWQAQTTQVFSGQVTLEKGDTLSIRTDVGFTTSVTSQQFHGINIKAIKDSSSFSVYGESKFDEVTGGLASFPVAANIWTDLDSFAVTPGEYDFTAIATGYFTNATTCDVGVSTVSGNTSPGTNAIDFTRQSAAAGQLLNVVWTKRLVLSSETTVYMKSRIDNTPTFVGYKFTYRKVK